MKNDLYIEVIADADDGDYVSLRSPIDEETVDDFKLLFKAIKKAGGNWPVTEYSEETLEEAYPKLDKDLLYGFDNYVPPNIHTIEDIRLLRVISEESLL